MKKTMKTKNLIIALLGVALVTSIAFNVNYNNKLEKTSLQLDTCEAVNYYILRQLDGAMKMTDGLEGGINEVKEFCPDYISLSLEIATEFTLKRMKKVFTDINYYALVNKGFTLNYKEFIQLAEELDEHWETSTHKDYKDCKMHDCEFVEKADRSVEAEKKMKEVIGDFIYIN